ncbi:predicted protein [Botrytis cinerea T4]|uniref:Uncharacterized protein n=1 Tax=Botryotinia fuckeliana (strain T4) TaxID=999810 RepID=G2Y9G0_BOTF4|nr:predicted protein [Botrytis cinerea T4]
MISKNNVTSVPLQQYDKQKMEIERKDYIELARFLFGNNWLFAKMILTFLCHKKCFPPSLSLGSRAAESLIVGTNLAAAYISDISENKMMPESRYTSMEQRINQNEVYETLGILRSWESFAGSENCNQNSSAIIPSCALLIFICADQLDGSFNLFITEFRRPDFVNKIWCDHPSRTTVSFSVTNPPRVIKLMKIIYDDAQWEYTKLALEWGFTRTNYTETKITRLHAEGCKVAEEYRRLLTSRNVAEEEVNKALRKYLDERCFDINETDVEATFDVVQAWDYYMSQNGDKISKFLEDVGNIDRD